MISKGRGCLLFTGMVDVFSFNVVGTKMSQRQALSDDGYRMVLLGSNSTPRRRC